MRLKIGLLEQRGAVAAWSNRISEAEAAMAAEAASSIKEGALRELICFIYKVMRPTGQMYCPLPKNASARQYDSLFGWLRAWDKHSLNSWVNLFPTSARPWTPGRGSTSRDIGEKVSQRYAICRHERPRWPRNMHAIEHVLVVLAKSAA